MLVLMAHLWYMPSGLDYCNIHFFAYYYFPAYHVSWNLYLLVFGYALYWYSDQGIFSWCCCFLLNFPPWWKLKIMKLLSSIIEFEFVIYIETYSLILYFLLEIFIILEFVGYFLMGLLKFLVIDQLVLSYCWYLFGLSISFKGLDLGSVEEEDISYYSIIFFSFLTPLLIL